MADFPVRLPLSVSYHPKLIAALVFQHSIPRIDRSHGLPTFQIFHFKLNVQMVLSLIPTRGS
jgi:hypothetical protein